MALSEAARAAKNRAHREWARKNRDKVKAINERYWEKKALKFNQLNQQEGSREETEKKTEK